MSQFSCEAARGAATARSSETAAPHSRARVASRPIGNKGRKSLAFGVYCLLFFCAENRVCLSKNRAENREESACAALLRALHASGGADEALIARGCPASLCTAP
jgi:hypothetical protein